MAADATAEEADAYDELLERVKRMNNVGYAAGVLGWDQQVMMPEGGAQARGKQLSTLSSISHELLVDERTGELLEELESRDLDGDRAAVVREVRRQYDRETAVPGELVEELTELSSEANQVWKQAKSEDDFDHFQPTLQRLVDLNVEKAEHIDPEGSTYETMYEAGSPYLPLSRVEEIFEELKAGLVPLVEDIQEHGDDLARPLADVSVDEDTQMELCREAVEFLGYDWDHGRLDTAPHPFMSGTQFDARITTRFDEDDPLDALTATVHEFGHATYQLGLPKDDYATPLGQPRSSGVHESQSRFWENHVGRTAAFWEEFLPTFVEHVPEAEGVTVQEMYETVNQIYPENLIRVEADELTYHMHIILRDEIEREFVEGDLAVEDIPGAWNEKMDRYLDVRPPTDAEGCLQDIHWTGGFGGFQGYTVGSVLAAQLHAAMQEDLDVEGCIRDRAFDKIREWQTEHVHRHGQRYTTDDLVERATGEPLTAEYFLDYAEAKFTDLYGL